jgi:hypothetical protein
MDQIWLQVFAVLIGAGILKYFSFHALTSVIIDVAALCVCYVILKRNPYVDLKKSMLVLSIFTAISLLNDIGVINDLISNVLILAILAWMIFRPGGRIGGRRRQSPSLRHKWHK